MIWYIAGAALFGVAALAVWSAFRSPSFVSGLVALAAKAAANAIVPKLGKRMTPDDEAEWRAAERRGQGDEWLARKIRGGHPGRER